MCKFKFIILKKHGGGLKRGAKVIVKCRTRYIQNSYPFNPNCTGLFCAMKKGPIAAKYGAHLRNCIKRMTSVLFSGMKIKVKKTH